MGEQRNRKIAAIRKLCASSFIFSGAPPFQFLCPLCETRYDSSDLANITEGHIIPKAANGTVWVFICKRCNSSAGTDVDKWFGEYLRLRMQQLPILVSRHIRNVSINDVLVGAEVSLDSAGAINVSIDSKRTSPASYDAISSALASEGLRSMKMEVPLLANRRSVFLGALQAGYLAFVRAFGYVIVAQRSWDIVRRQLTHLDEDILPPKFAALAHGHRQNEIGFARVDGRTCAFAAFFGVIVFFPPADDDGTFYRNLPEDYPSASVEICPLSGEGPPAFASCALIVNRDFVIWPTKNWTMIPWMFIAHFDDAEGTFLVYRQIDGAYTTDRRLVLVRGDRRIALEAPLAPSPD